MDLDHPRMNRWRQLFGERRPLIGVIHLPPLPGSPGWGGDMAAVEARALADAQAYVGGGATAVLVENFGDHPFFPHQVPPETVAAMGRIATAVVQTVSLPVGINVLRNDGAAALAVAVASGAQFIRVNVLSGAMVTDQGLIQGCAAPLLRQRRLLAADGATDGVAVLADVLVKHALPLAPLPMHVAVQDTLARGGADGVIVSGDSTGTPVEPEVLQQARHGAQGAPVLIGSGFGPATADRLGPLCDGVIVASALKQDGRLWNPVDPQRVAQLRSRFHP